MSRPDFSQRGAYFSHADDGCASGSRGLFRAHARVSVGSDGVDQNTRTHRENVGRTQRLENSGGEKLRAATLAASISISIAFLYVLGL